MKGEDTRTSYASYSFSHVQDQLDSNLFDDGFHISIQFRSKQQSTNSFTIMYIVYNYQKTTSVTYENTFYFESEIDNMINVSEQAVFFIDYKSDKYKELVV